MASTRLIWVYDSLVAAWLFAQRLEAATLELIASAIVGTILTVITISAAAVACRVGAKGPYGGTHWAKSCASAWMRRALKTVHTRLAPNGSL